MVTVKSSHVFALLTLFWAAWVYTEVSEYLERREFNSEINDFMHRGDRFTAEDGIELNKRLDAVEKRQHEILKGQNNDK